MTHTQLIYLVLVVVAFLVFTGSLMIATIASLSSGAKDGKMESHPGTPRPGH